MDDEYYITYGNFNPRSPHGERRNIAATFAKGSWHFNPRSPHGERRVPYITNGRAFSISIHAPRTGSDAHVNWLCAA